MAERTPHDDVVGHSTADDQYLETPPGAQYEHTDASVWLVVKFLVWLTVAAIVIHAGLAVLFELFARQRVEREAPQYPLAATEAAKVPPEPRLQRFPREDLMNFRLGEETRLRHYGWVDRPGGIVHIPIEAAMRLALERGLFVSRAPEDPPPADASSDPPPADSSAGRPVGRR